MKIIKSLIIIITLFYIYGCENKEKDIQDVVRPAVVTKPILKSTNIDTQFTGAVSAIAQTKLSFKVNGNIKKIYVKLGQKVRKGDLIAELDNKDYSLQLQTAQSGLKTAKLGIEESKTKFEQANAALELAKAQAEQAKTGVENVKVQYDTISKKFDRISKLYEDGTVAASDYETAKMTRDSAKLGLNSAYSALEQAKTGVKNALVVIEQSKVGMVAAESQVGTVSKNVEMASNQLDYSKLYSPEDGDIAIKTAEDNENIGAGMPVVILTTGKNYEVKIYIPEIVISQLYIGQSAGVRIDAVPNKVFKAKIKEIGNTSTGFGVTFPVTLTIEEHSEKIRPGMTAEVNIGIKNGTLTKNSVYLPLSSVQKDSQGTYIFILTKNSSFYILRKKYVTIGKVSDYGIEIADGVNGNEQVLYAGGRFAYDGEQVTPKNAVEVEK